MAATKEKWTKVKFSPEEEPKCVIRIRANGQIGIGAEAMEAMGNPQYINFYTSVSNNLIAMQAGSKSDPDAIRVSTKQPETGKGVDFRNQTAYKWICSLLEQENVNITLFGEAHEGGKIVFDLNKIEVRKKTHADCEVKIHKKRRLPHQLRWECPGNCVNLRSQVE